MSDPSDLSNLRDLALPPEIAWWPPAPGWWIAAAAGLATAAILAATAVAHHQRNAYRRQALRALDAATPRDISSVLKRTALAAWPRDQVAPLSGPAWLAFLDRTGGTTAFTNGPGRDLEALAFGGAVDAAAVPGILAAARTWVRAHRC